MQMSTEYYKRTNMMVLLVNPLVLFSVVRDACHHACAMSKYLSTGKTCFTLKSYHDVEHRITQVDKFASL